MCVAVTVVVIERIRDSRGATAQRKCRSRGLSSARAGNLSLFGFVRKPRNRTGLCDCKTLPVGLVWVTGSSGTGKSTVRVELARRGYASFDTDQDGITAWRDRTTGQEVDYPSDLARDPTTGSRGTVG